jgi:hypothetical protein
MHSGWPSIREAQTTILPQRGPYLFSINLLKIESGICKTNENKILERYCSDYTFEISFSMTPKCTMSRISDLCASVILHSVEWKFDTDVSGQWSSLKMGPIGCPETSLTNYHSTLRKIPEECISHLHRSRSLKSWVAYPLGHYEAASKPVKESGIL